MLAGYEKVFPGCAERIVGMAESQLAHRQQLEAAHLAGTLAAERRGQLFGFALGGVAILGGVLLIALDKDVQGLIAILAALGTLLGAFVYGRWSQTKEREQKRREVEAAQQQMKLPLELD
jgi:uncharacterized membrane protein